MKRLLDKSGTGEDTAWPPGLARCKDGTDEPDASMAAARLEAEECETKREEFNNRLDTDKENFKMQIQ